MLQASGLQTGWVPSEQAFVTQAGRSGNLRNNSPGGEKLQRAIAWNFSTYLAVQSKEKIHLSL